MERERRSAAALQDDRVRAGVGTRGSLRRSARPSGAPFSVPSGHFAPAAEAIVDGFCHVPVFPPLVTSLIAVGEETGSLDEMLEFVILQYDMDIKYSLRNLTAMVEPMVTVVIGTAVLFFALAVYLPIWNLSSVIRQ